MSDAETLISFLGLPSASIMQRLLHTSERLLGPIEMDIEEKGMKDAINEEIFWKILRMTLLWMIVALKERSMGI